MAWRGNQRIQDLYQLLHDQDPLLEPEEREEGENLFREHPQAPPPPIPAAAAIAPLPPPQQPQQQAVAPRQPIAVLQDEEPVNNNLSYNPENNNNNNNEIPNIHQIISDFHIEGFAQAIRGRLYYPLLQQQREQREREQQQQNQQLQSSSSSSTLNSSGQKFLLAKSIMNTGVSIGGNPSATNDIRALEHQTLKVPYEILNKKFRLAQKNIDREVSHVQTSINELEKVINQQQLSGYNQQLDDSANTRIDQIQTGDNSPNTSIIVESGQLVGEGNESMTVSRINELLQGVVQKLSVLKRKSVESITDEIEAAQVCKRRLDHLKEYCWVQRNLTKAAQENPLLTSDVEDPVLINWKRKRMDRMLVDHCLRSGYYDTAIRLTQCSDIQNLTNIDIFLVCKEIEESLQRHETPRCLGWCHENKSKLRKIKSTLEFNLRQQEFIELIRSNQRLEAVRYAQKYFTNLEELTDTSTNNDLLRVMGLLACSPDTDIDRYRALFEEKRWTKLIELFRLENFKLYQLSQTSIFAITLQAGLSSLKTPQCYRKDGNKNSECPVCSELLNKLASSLPCAHCSQSRLVCYISCEPMNEYNQPLMLPNGYVYGEKALKKMADDNDGQVTCPRTRETFDFDLLQKVFVM